MTENKMFFRVIACLFLFILHSSCYAFSGKPSQIGVSVKAGEAYYLMDKALVDDGYYLRKSNNDISVLYRGEVISASQVYMESMGPDKALKLFIQLNETLKNANVYLNNVLLTKTDKDGMAVVDRYKTAGYYLLKVSIGARSVNYFFSLVNGSRVVCAGVSDFRCNISKYS